MHKAWRFALIAMAAVLVSGPAAAQGFEGLWRGSMLHEDGRNPSQVTLNVATAGGAMTAALKVAGVGRVQEGTDVKVEGGELKASFNSIKGQLVHGKLSADGNGMTATWLYEDLESQIILQRALAAPDAPK